MKENPKQHFFTSAPKKGLQNREKGYTESKKRSKLSGSEVRMYRKLLSFFAILLICISVASPAHAWTWGGVWDSITDAVSSAGEAIVDGVTAAGEAIVDGVTAAGEAIVDGVQYIGNTIGGWLGLNSCTERCPCDPEFNPQSLFVQNMKDYTEENRDACWFCSVFETMFAAINGMVTAVFNSLGNAFLTLMGIGLLFLILFKVGKMLVQLQEVDVMQFLNDLFKPLGRAIVAMALLLGVTTQSDHVFNMIVGPVFEVSMKLGTVVMDTALPNNVTYIQADAGTGTYVYEAGRCDDIDTLQSNGQAFSNGQQDLLTCWLKQISSSFIVGIAIGGTLMDVGTEGTNFFTGGFTMTIVGFTIWACFYLIYLFFPFKVVDSFVRIAFVLTLMPLWIILWVFPTTVGYTKKAWEMFLGSCVTFIILSIMVSLSVILMSNSIPEADRNGLLQCLRAGNDNNAMTWVSFGSGAMLNTIAFAAMSWTLLGTAGTLANSLVGGGGDLGVGTGMAGLTARGASATWSAAKSTAKVGLWGIGALGGLAAAAGRRSGSGRSGGSGGKPAASLGQYNRNNNRSQTTSQDNTGSFNSLSQSDQNSVSNRVNDTIGSIRNAFTNSSSSGRGNSIKNNMGLQVILKGAKSPEERGALTRMIESMDKTATGRGANRRPGQPNQEDIKALQEIYAQERIENDSKQQTQQVSELQNQQRQETDTTERKQTRQEEAIQKLHENPRGMQAVRDTQTNMAFIQEQMASASSVSELRDNLKNHTWAYSGNNREDYVRDMMNAAEYMMNAQKAENPDRMKREVTTALNNSLKHGNISDRDAIVNSVVQQMGGNFSSLNDILANLTKKE